MTKPVNTTADKVALSDTALADIRTKIDKIDRDIQTLIAERACYAQQVGQAKSKLAAAMDYDRPSVKRRCYVWWWNAMKVRCQMKC